MTLTKLIGLFDWTTTTKEGKEVLCLQKFCFPSKLKIYVLQCMQTLFTKLICSFVSSNLVPKHDAKIEAHQIPLRFRSSLTIAFLQFLIFYDLTYKCLNKTVHKWHIIILCRGIRIRSTDKQVKLHIKNESLMIKLLRISNRT